MKQNPSISFPVPRSPFRLLAVLCLLSSVLCLPPSAFSVDIAPVEPWDVNLPDYATHDVTISRGETRILQPRFLSDRIARDLTEATSVVLLYKGSGETNYMARTGSVYLATNGQVRARWDSACESTNSVYSYQLRVNSGSSVVCRTGGFLTLIPDITYQASTSAPTAMKSIDWLTALNLNTGYAPFFSQPTNRQAGDMWYYDGTNTVRFPIGTAGQTLLVVGSGPQWGNAGAGDMLTSIYDPLSVGTTAVFVTDSRLTNARPPAAHTQAWSTVSGTPDTLAGYGLTNAATAAQGALADTALQPATTNGWEVGSHASFLTAEADTNALAQLATETNRAAQAEAALVSKTDTNGWEVGSHASFLTAEADTNALAQLATETNRAAQAEAAAKNAANHTNALFCLPWQIEQPTNTTRYYLIYSAADKSGKLEKISGCVTSGVVGLDVCLSDSTNPALSVSTINYTGAYFTTAMSNITLNITYTNRQKIYLSITNGYGLQYIGALEARE